MPLRLVLVGMFCNCSPGCYLFRLSHCLLGVIFVQANKQKLHLTNLFLPLTTSLSGCCMFQGALQEGQNSSLPIVGIITWNHIMPPDDPSHLAGITCACRTSTMRTLLQAGNLQCRRLFCCSLVSSADKPLAGTSGSALSFLNRLKQQRPKIRPAVQHLLTLP
jgi:hypothetical protein